MRSTRPPASGAGKVARTWQCASPRRRPIRVPPGTEACRHGQTESVKTASSALCPAGCLGAKWNGEKVPGGGRCVMRGPPTRREVRGEKSNTSPASWTSRNLFRGLRDTGDASMIAGNVFCVPPDNSLAGFQSPSDAHALVQIDSGEADSAWRVSDPDGAGGCPGADAGGRQGARSGKGPHPVCSGYVDDRRWAASEHRPRDRADPGRLSVGQHPGGARALRWPYVHALQQEERAGVHQQ